MQCRKEKKKKANSFHLLYLALHQLNLSQSADKAHTYSRGAGRALCCKDVIRARLWWWCWWCVMERQRERERETVSFSHGTSSFLAEAPPSPPYVPLRTAYLTFFLRAIKRTRRVARPNKKLGEEKVRRLFVYISLL